MSIQPIHLETTFARAPTQASSQVNSAARGQEAAQRITGTTTFNPTVLTAGRWLLLAGLFFLITGDGPSTTVRLTRWPTPLPFLGWQWLHVVLIGAGAACMVAGGGVKSWRLPQLRFLLTPLAVLLGAFVLSTAFSEVHTLSAVALLSVVFVVGSCYLLAVLLEDEPLRTMVWPTIAVAMLLLAVRVILWRRDEGLDVVAYQVLNNAWQGKLQLAWVFNLFAPPLLAHAMGESRRRHAVLYVIAWAVTGVATYVLFSRMGSIVFAVATFGVCIMNPGQWRKVLVILVLGAAIGAGLVARSDRMSRYIVTTILRPDSNPGVEQRLGVWREAVRLFQSRPITGTGLGTYDEVTYHLADTTAGPEFRRQGWHAHNVYLHVLSETGILGIAAWCFFWYAIVARLTSLWRHAHGRDRLFVAGALWAVLAFLVLSMTEVLIGARVHASLRMNMAIGVVVVLGLQTTVLEGLTRRENRISAGLSATD
jgi:O-antigen ligase